MKAEERHSAGAEPLRTKSTDIDLRSPRMRRLLDHIPGRLTTLLVLLSLIIIAGIALAAVLLPYPYSGGESILSHMMASGGR